ncbi:MAG: ABC transporter permease subunit [Spirochaetales bacterium]|nr:ABC transporter permease subunit [Spirochaetales bacterium]
MNKIVMSREVTALVAFGILIASGLFFNIVPKTVFSHIGLSLYRMMTGYIISIIVGTTLAVILGMNIYIRTAVKPLLSFLMSIPTIAWVPLLLIIIGINEQSIIIAIFLGSFFAVVFNTLEGFDNVPQVYFRAASVMNYGRLHMLLRIAVPASFNGILVGWKLGIAYSWRALVGAEMLGAATGGLGYLAFASRKFYNLGMLLYTLAFIGLLGYLLNRFIIASIERKTVRKWGIT